MATSARTKETGSSVTTAVRRATILERMVDRLSKGCQERCMLLSCTFNVCGH